MTDIDDLIEAGAELLADETEPAPCAAVVWRGNAWGPTPEPDEMCERDALPDSEFCELHTDPRDC